MRKFGIALVVMLAVLAAGFYIFTARKKAALEGYANKNIAFGAVSTVEADALCPKVSPETVADAVAEMNGVRPTPVAADKSAPATAASGKAAAAGGGDGALMKAEAIGAGFGHQRLVCLADALKASLSPEMKTRMLLPYTLEDAKKWSNFPPVGYPNRVGPTLGDFDAKQLGIIKAMLKEAAGIAANEGYDELEQILNADDFLKANTDDEAGFSSSNFHIAFLGNPAPTGTWELYFGGHHLAFANTYKDGRLMGATPSFRGVEPFTAFAMNGRDNAPMAQEQAAFAAMLGALSPLERSRAKLTELYTDIVAGPQKDDNFPVTREGMRVGDLALDQQALVLKAIETYVGDVSPQEAATIMAKYRAELPDTYIAFSGTPGLTAENDYVRIDGPSVWIELSIQPGRSIPGVHPHSVWRDRASDYAGSI